MMNAAIYARKSTKQEGVSEDAKSVRRQEELGRAFANSKGWSVVAVFTDDAISGAEFERRLGLQKLLAAARRAEFQTLIVSEQKSIGREMAMLIGCGLRRAELLALTCESVQQREEHWVIADLVGKGGHVRRVPIPGWVKDAVDAWTDAVDITHGPVFRAINRAGRVWGDGMSPKMLWDVVRAAARSAGIEKLAPH